MATDLSPGRCALPAGVWVLGSVSLMMDVCSEMIDSMLPFVLVGTLGVSLLAASAHQRQRNAPSAILMDPCNVDS
jgi:hypothetical protein